MAAIDVQSKLVGENLAFIKQYHLLLLLLPEFMIFLTRYVFQIEFDIFLWQVEYVIHVSEVGHIQV